MLPPSVWQLYNITFGHYALLLAGLTAVFCAAAAGVAFLLARFSANAVTMLIKLVPLGAALALLLFLILRGALSYSWMYPSLLRGRVLLAELWLTLLVALLGSTATAMTLRRERRVDVA